MRSQYHLLRDMETEAAPTLALSNTITSDTAKTQETGGHLAPCFSCSPADSPGPSKNPCPAGHTSASNPHGNRLPYPSTYRRGIATARTKPLAPPYAKLLITAHASLWRATQPPTLQPRRFVNNNKKRLRFMLEWCRIMAPRQIKGRARGATNTSRPYAGAIPPTQ